MEERKTTHLCLLLAKFTALSLAIQTGCEKNDPHESFDDSTDTGNPDTNDSDSDTDSDSDSDETGTDSDSDSDGDTDTDIDTGTYTDTETASNCDDIDTDWFVDAGPEYPFDGGFPDHPYGFDDSVDEDIDPANIPTGPVAWNGEGNTIPNICLPNANGDTVCLGDFFRSAEYDLLVVDMTTMW